MVMFKAKTPIPAVEVKKRGFAAMDPDVQRKIASLGGSAAHRSGTAHEFAPGEEARAAGRKSAVKRAENIAKKKGGGK